MLIFISLLLSLTLLAIPSAILTLLVSWLADSAWSFDLPFWPLFWVLFVGQMFLRSDWSVKTRG